MLKTQFLSQKIMLSRNQIKKKAKADLVIAIY